MAERDDLRSDDERLRRLFAQMREQDRGAVPPFPAIETRPAIAWGRLMATAAASAAAVVVAVLLVLPGGREPSDDTLLLAEWSAPSSDFLGLGDLGVEFAVSGEDEYAVDSADTMWMSLPTDGLMDTADEWFGPESER